MECTVCLNQWSSTFLPAILDCNHILCIHCCVTIHQQMNNIPCPQCRRKTYAAANELPISQTIQDLQKVKEQIALNEFSIFVMNLRNKTIALKVKKSIKIYDLKLEIEKSEGIPPETQRLIFCGKCLEEDKTLDFYNITQHNTLFLVSRMKG